MVIFYVVTIGGGVVLMVLGFLGVYLGRRRGRPKIDVSLPATVLLVAGFVLISLAALPFRDQH